MLILVASITGEALNVAEGQDEYLVKMTTPASAAAHALGEATETAPWDALHTSGKTMFRFSNAWTTDVVEAKTLAMFAYMTRARRVMEIGMFTGELRAKPSVPCADHASFARSASYPTRASSDTIMDPLLHHPQDMEPSRSPKSYPRVAR